MGASTSKYKFKNNKHQSHRADRPSSPGKPTLKQDLHNVDPETVTIKWDAPLYDGGTKITGYLVEHKRTGSPHWVKASPLKVRQTQLTVCGLEPGWRYQFRVSAENAIGLSEPSPLSEPLAIFVHRSAAIAPYFLTELYDLAVLENEKVEFNVSFEGVPSPKISWYKDGLELFSNRCQKISTEGCLSRYIIYEATTSDESEIKCTATNKVGYAVTKAYLKVEAPPTVRPPRQYEDGLIFEQGELIRLKVSVVGQPHPEVYWYLNGEPLDPSARYEMEYEDNTAILKVKGAQRTDRGEYQIQAVNTLGEDVASILVTITNKPQPPTNISITKIQGNSVTLEWLKPEDDGGCKIGSYIIEYYKTGWGVWLKAATSRHQTITLDDLIKGSQYKFRIKAENPYGVSDPSGETETIFISDAKKRIFRPEDVPKHLQESLLSNFPTHLDVESQTETDGSCENLPQRKHLAPEKPKRKRMKTPLPGASNSDQDDHQRGLTPSPQPFTNSDDLSTTSSELMLVLVPSSEDMKQNRKGNGSLDGASYFSPKDMSNLESMPPPISLSAPELGSEIQFFKPLQRNCVSSTEILHESTIARFYKELQEENGLNKLKQQFNLPSNKKIAKKSIEDVITSRISVDVARRPSPKIKAESPKTNLPRSKPFEDNLNISGKSLHGFEENSSKVTSSTSPDFRRRRPSKLPDNSPSNFCSDNNHSTQGRYSPKSGTFHYPDLFMESLTKSPQFRFTSPSPPKIVPDVSSRRPMQFDSYSISTPLAPTPKVIITHEDDPQVKLDTDWNRHEPSESETTSDEDATSDDEDDDFENDTYHPQDRSPLSFEQALAISNPKRSTSPTNDLFLECDDGGLHYFNPNYDFEGENHQDEEDLNKRPKSILKYPGYNETVITNSPTSTLSRGSLQFQSSSQGLLRLNKKVRIEEPSKATVTEDHDTSHVIINHYSDIVKQFGNVQKPSTKVYMTYDELRAAAQTNEDELHDHFVEDDETKEHDCDKFEYVPMSPLLPERRERSCSPKNINRSLYAAQVRHNVHFFLDFFIDVMLFTSACWLFCFKDERLAIPVIILLVYRQLYEKMKNKFSNFKFWRRKNCEKGATLLGDPTCS